MADLAAFAASECALFGAAYLYFQKGLFSDFEVSRDSVWAQVLFAATFALSCGMLELIIFEIVGYSNRHNRLALWNAVLPSMLVLLIGVLPARLADTLIFTSPPLVDLSQSLNRLPTRCAFTGQYCTHAGLQLR